MDKSNRRYGRARGGAPEQRSKFAEGIARAEFGRFYWNGRQAERLEEAMKAPKPSPAGRKKPVK